MFTCIYCSYKLSILFLLLDVHGKSDPKEIIPSGPDDISPNSASGPTQPRTHHFPEHKLRSQYRKFSVFFYDRYPLG